MIYFHAGEEQSAAHLAAIVEDVRARVGAALGLTPPPLTHVVLADQAEAANGWATPLPRDTVFLSAAVPSGAELIGRSSDWLRLVFTHEYTHIVHLDRSRGWARAVRAVFGRNALALPNLLLPEWQIEGLADLAGEHHHRRGASARRRLSRHQRECPPGSDVPSLWMRRTGGWSAGPMVTPRTPLDSGFMTTSPVASAASHSGPSPMRRQDGYLSRRRRFSGAFRYIPRGALAATTTRELSAESSRTAAGDSTTTPPERLTYQGNIVSGPRFAPAACARVPGRDHLLEPNAP